MNTICSHIIRASLCAAILALAACTQHLGDEPDPQGQPITLNIPGYPAWPSPVLPCKGEVAEGQRGQGEYPEGGRGSLTRTIIDPDNPLKTQWQKGDELRIMMRNNTTYTSTYGTATYNGQRWESDLRWPIGATDSYYFDCWYLGNKSNPGDELWDTDILAAESSSVSPGDPVILGNYRHVTNRIILHYASENTYYLGGSGFVKYKVADNGYGATTERLDNNNYLPIPASPATVYLGVWFGATNIYTKEGDEYQLAGTLNLEYTFGSGRIYTIDLDALGTITPGGMNEEQEKARFLAWADDCRNSNYNHFTLQTDINLTGIDWQAVDFANCTFDGGGHTISGLKVTQANAANDAGLFGSVSGCTIKNLHVSGSIEVQGDNNGGIAGFIQFSTLENVSFTGGVAGGSIFTGGIAGHAMDSYLFACQYLGDNTSLGIGTANPNSYIIGCRTRHDGKTATNLNDEIAAYNNSNAGQINPCRWQWTEENGIFTATFLP